MFVILKNQKNVVDIPPRAQGYAAKGQRGTQD
jgi:hypothetical protein